jgi:hypothetical protein
MTGIIKSAKVQGIYLVVGLLERWRGQWGIAGQKVENS